MRAVAAMSLTVLADTVYVVLSIQHNGFGRDVLFPPDRRPQYIIDLQWRLEAGYGQVFSRAELERAPMTPNHLRT